MKKGIVRNMKEKKIITRWIYWFTFAVAVILVYKTLDSFTDVVNWIKSLFSVLMPFIIGILIAYLFYIPSRKMESIYNKSRFKLIRKKSRLIGVLTVYIIAVIICVIAIKFIIPSIAQSIVDLVNNLPGYYENAKLQLEQMPQDSFLNKVNAKDILKDLESIDIKQYFNLENLTQYAKGVLNIATSIFGFFVSFIVSIYLLLERKEILGFLRKLFKVIFKDKTYKNLGNYFTKTNEIFFKFISSQLLDAIVVGILASIALLILDVKYAILLGFMIGISNIIPYFGAIVGVSISILITIFTGGIPKAILMGIIIIVLQQIDANIINPKIVGNSLKLSPILVIFAVTIGGAYFNILGMFLAVPVIAVLKIIIQDYINYKNEVKEPNIIKNIN